MEIVHLGHVAFCPGHPDFGKMPRHPGNWVLHHAMAQRALGLNARVITQTPPGSRPCRMEVHGVPVAFHPSRGRYRAASLFYLDRRHLAREVWRDSPPALIHAHGFEDVYALAAEQTRLPYVVTAQGMRFMQKEVLQPPLLSRFTLIAWLENRSLRKLGHVIAKSENVLKALQEKYPHLALHHIPNTFDPALLEIHESKEPYTLAFVGSVTPRKGVHLISQALEACHQRFPELRLIIAGNKEQAPSAYEQRELDRLRSFLGDRLELLGTVPQLVMARRVARARILLAPSLEEMFGNQLIEALLVGTHGIVAEGTALAENVRRFGNGTVVPQGDAHALTRAITDVLEGERFPEARQARDRICAFMGPDAVAKAHAEVYESVLRESSRSAYLK